MHDVTVRFCPEARDRDWSARGLLGRALGFNIGGREDEDGRLGRGG